MLKSIAAFLMPNTLVLVNR